MAADWVGETVSQVPPSLRANNSEGARAITGADVDGLCLRTRAAPRRGCRKTLTGLAESPVMRRYPDWAAGARLRLHVRGNANDGGDAVRVGRARR